MAQKPLYILQAVEVRRANEQGTSSAIIISTLTLPPLTFATAEHNPGGGVMAVNFAMPRLEPLEPAFSVKGIDNDVFRGMGNPDRWVFAAAYKDRRTNRDVPVRGIIEAAVTGWEPDESDPADMQGCNYAFTEVTHYEFTMDGTEKVYFDFYERIARRNGEDLWAGIRNALGA